MMFVAVTLITFTYSTLANSKYVFETFNVGLSGSPTTPYRDEKIAESISQIRSQGNLDILCLQQVPFARDVNRYSTDLLAEFPYSYSSVTDRVVPSIPCTSQQQSIFNSPQNKGCMQAVEAQCIQSNHPNPAECTLDGFLSSCIAPVANDATHPGSATVTSWGQALQHSECMGCLKFSATFSDDDMSKVSMYGDDNDPTSISLLNRCSNAVTENIIDKVHSGFLILSKYPILEDGRERIDLPSGAWQPREYALVEIELEDETITYGCGGVYPSYPFLNEPSETDGFLGFGHDGGSWDIFQQSGYNGIVEQSLNEIRDALSDSNTNYKQVITGDFSVGIDMMSASSLYTDFMGDTGLVDAFVIDNDFRCSVCAGNTHNFDDLYAFGQPSHSPDQIFISSDVSQVKNTKRRFTQTFTASDGTTMHISKHYGKKAKLVLSE